MAEMSVADLLWKFDPSGIVVVDKDMTIKLVNPSFCRIFRVDAETIKGQPLSRALQEDPRYFIDAWEKNRPLRGHEKLYMDNNAYIYHLIFPIPERGLVIGILTDMTREWQRRQKLDEVLKKTRDEYQAMGRPENSHLPAVLEILQDLLG